MAKWEGKVSVTLTKASADQIWALFRDFFNFHKWFPNLSTSYGLHGINGEVGATRYCAGFSLPVTDTEGGADYQLISWSKERLVAVDPIHMSMTYEIVDCNIGFDSYVSTIKVIDGGGAKQGCIVEWSFSVDPVQGLTLEYMVHKYQAGLHETTKKMEDALLT